MRNGDWVAAGGICFLVLLFGGLIVFAIVGTAEENRVNRACLDMGYESSTAYLWRGVPDYCHKWVDGTTVTVRLERARWGE